MGYKVKTTDDIVLKIIKKIDERSIEGQRKYGDTMMSEVNSGKKDLARFMVDVQEELTDMLLYMEAARACLKDEIEECYLRDFRNISTFPEGQTTCTMDCDCTDECKFDVSQ